MSRNRKLSSPGIVGLCAVLLTGTAAVTITLATAAQAANTSKGYSTVYDFCQQANCADGQDPIGGVIADTNGNLYGTTQYGGTGNRNGSACYSGYYGCGTVYKIAPDGTETVLYSFCSQTNCEDGGLPTAGLVMDSAGNLYGTTSSNYGNGPGIFEIAPDGTETVLSTFVPVPYGAQPSGLVMDDGYLLGTLSSDLEHRFNGEVFDVPQNGGDAYPLYTFCSREGCIDGSNPTGGVIFDEAYNVYGTTTEGGANGGGVVFKIDDRGYETVLYSFCSQPNCTDGSQPTGSLVEDRHGNFYGVTSGGGANGTGTVYEVAANGTETVLYSFCSDSQHGHCLDGAYPQAGLLEQGRRFYGTATQGGEGEYGSGVVFSLAGGTEKPLYSFGQYADGFASTPYAGLLSLNGFLYGTAESGGWSGGGIVFQLGTRGGSAR